MQAQKPKAKNMPWMAAQTERAKAGGRNLVRVLFGSAVNLDRARDLVRNNFELGQRHFKLGNIRDAALRFRLVTWMEPSHAEAWYYLGRCRLLEGQKGQAARALEKALALSPKHEEARYLLAVALGSKAAANELPGAMPLSLAHEHFEGLADGYDEMQEEAGYQGHMLLNEAVRPALAEGRVDHVALDLGCGTGLIGTGLRDVAAEIRGVDFSEKMLSHAMARKDGTGRKIYDALIHRELREFLREAPEAAYDIMLAGCTFNYVGELDAVFSASARALRPGGVFAFTAARRGGEGFGFDPVLGQFTFSLSYLRAAAAAAGMKEIGCQEAPVYPDDKMWLCVFRRQA